MKKVGSTKEVDTFELVGASGSGGRVKKDRVNRKKKAKTRTWFDVVKGLNPEDELENTNSDKSQNKPEVTDSDQSWNELETADSIQQTDSEEPDRLKAKRTRRQQKMTLT